MQFCGILLILFCSWKTIIEPSIFVIDMRKSDFCLRRVFLSISSNQLFLRIKNRLIHFVSLKTLLILFLTILHRLSHYSLRYTNITEYIPPFLGLLVLQEHHVHPPLSIHDFTLSFCTGMFIFIKSGIVSASFLTLIRYSIAFLGSLSNDILVPTYFGRTNASRLIRNVIKKTNVTRRRQFYSTF